MSDLIVIKNRENVDLFINKIIDVFHLSVPNKYIILNIKLDKLKSFVNLSVYDENGLSDKFDDVCIECGDYFYKSLENIVIEFRDYCYVDKEDIVNLDGDDLVTFRMITKNNDLFTIDGLDKEFANKLLELFRK